MLAAVTLLALSLQVPSQCRREVLLGCATAAINVVPLRATAYDTVPQQTADFEKAEKLRLARAAAIKKNKEAIKPMLDAVKRATTNAEYSDGVEQLTVWIIGKGSLPEGIDAREVRDVIQDTWEALPVKAYACEMTRTNKGICYSPGEPADSAHDSALTELRKYATRKGKGSLMSDGISAANSAAF